MLVLTCFDALALDFGRIDFRSLLANDYRHGIAVRREDFRLGKPRWQHGAKVYGSIINGLCKEISPQNMALYGTVPPF